MRCRRALLVVPSIVAGALCVSACLAPGVHTPIAPDLPSTQPVALPMDAASVARDGMVQVRGAWLRVRSIDPSAGPTTDATPVAFVHGYGSRLESWRLVQPAIAAGRRTVSYDQRGFGRSERPPTTEETGYGALEHARDLWALLDAQGITDVVLVGHSYGCAVVLRAALLAPERVKGIVLVSPFVLESQKNSFLRWAEVPGVGEWLYTTSYRDFSGEKMHLVFAEPERFATLEALDEIAANHALPGTSYAALATVRGMQFADSAPAYATLSSKPLRVVWGEKDRVTPIRLSREVLAALGAQALPQGVLVRVPDVGHMPPWEQPAAVVDALDAVLAAQARAP